MKKSKEKIIQSGKALNEVFEDSYEHEVYLGLVQSLEVCRLCPNNIEIELSLKIKKPRLSFPDNDPRLIKVLIPISKSQDTPRKKAELRFKNFSKYAELVPNMRFSIRNQIAVLRKDLINEEEAIIIEEAVKRARNAGLERIKKKIYYKE